MNEETMRVLKMIEEGKITPKEGTELLKALKSEKPTSPGESSKDSGIAEMVGKKVKEKIKDLKGLGGINAEEIFERELQISPNGQLFLKNFSGDITVKSWEEPMVKVEAVKHARGRTQQEARENTQKIEIDIHQEEDTVRIATKMPSSGLGWGRGRWVDYNLSVPQNINLELETMSGDIETEDIQGNVKINAKSGDLRTKKIRGDVEAVSLSGDVVMEEIKGNLTVKSLSGDMRGKDIVSDSAKISLHSGDANFTKLQGNLTVDSLSGDARLADMDCLKLRVNSKSGDIEVSESIKPEGNYFLKTLSGDIRMRIPPDASAHIEASARTGDIRCTLPVKIEKKTNHELCAVLGEGKAKVELISLSGDISLEGKE